MGKRILLFVATNIVFMLTISILFNVMGVDGYITEGGIDYKVLATMCLVWGFVGSFFSLAISRWVAKRMLGVKLIDPSNPGDHAWLVQCVQNAVRGANLPAMPEVGIYEAEDINAFATGPSRSRSLVAFSSGLLSKMERDEVEAVAGHEVAHIANGDMVTMTLLQGVLNAFIMFFARIVAHVASQAVDEKLSRIVWYATIFAMQIGLGILAMPILGWFSRKREFRADAGAAAYVGREKMIKALERLTRVEEQEELPAALAAFGIDGKGSRSKSMWALWAASHPALEDRIAALKQSR